MKLKKQIVVFSLACVFILTVLYWWYTHPINYINKTTDLDIPFLETSVVSSEEKSTWQDAHYIYVLSVQSNAINELMASCKSRVNEVMRKNSAHLDIYKNYIKNPALDTDIDTCFLSSDKIGSNWAVSIIGAYVIFEYRNY